MLLHSVVFCSALILFLLTVATLVVIFTRRWPHSETVHPNAEKTSKALLDFSDSKTEGEQMQKFLSAALLSSTTDTEFEQRFRSGIDSATGLEAELSWAWLERTLMEYRRGSEFEPSPRRMAERFLADIPRRYCLKAAAPQQTPHAQ